MERDWRPNAAEMIPHCPRCGSSNTKFCYYNNYSLTQPRYFCKGCRRYWTKGGSLRNVPVGGGCRKHRRSKSSSSSSLRPSSTGRACSFVPKNNNLSSINQTTSSDHHGDGDGGAGSNNNNFDPNCSIEPLVGCSSDHNDGPNIDLALVYASYVNQPQDQQQTPLELPPIHHRRHLHVQEVGVLPPPFDFSGAGQVPELDMGQEHQAQFNSNSGGGRRDCLLTFDASQSSAIIPPIYHHLYMSELDSSSSVGIMQQENGIVIEGFTGRDTRSNNNAFELPPLPGEELSSVHDMVPLPLPMPWLDSQVTSDHPLPSSDQQMQVEMQMQGLPSESQDLNQLVGDWSPFDLPNYETLSRH